MKLQIAMLLFLATTNAFAEIEIRFDRFTNKTRVSAPVAAQLAARADVALTPNWLADFSGQQPTALPSQVTLIFWKTSKSWEYLRCHSTAMLVDNTPFPLSESKHSGTPERGYVIERIRMSLTIDQAIKLSEAKLVEFKVCNTEGQFSENDLQDLRKFIKALTP